MELKKLIEDAEKMVHAICDGLYNDVLKEKMNANEAWQKQIKRILENTAEETVILHPSMAARYLQEVQSLVQSFRSEEHRSQAAKMLRSLVDKIVLSPKMGSKELMIDLHGDLAGILTISAEKKTSEWDRQALIERAQAFVNSEDFSATSKSQGKLVADAGIEPNFLMFKMQEMAGNRHFL